MAVTSLTGIDESDLVAQAREGDTTAFNELVRRYEGKIFRLGQHVTQNREDAEDVLRSEEHTSELQSPCNLVCRLLLEKTEDYNRKAGDRQSTSLTSRHLVISYAV